MPRSRDPHARLVVHEGAAAGGQHLRPLLQQAGDDPALAVAEMRLAVMAKISGIVMPAAASTSGSASTKRQAEPLASRRPTVVLPAPIRPTSTIDRAPAEDGARGSGRAMGAAGVVADIVRGSREHGRIVFRRRS